MDIIEVWIPCPDRTVADALAAEAVGERLAACANVLGGMSSSYHWQGALEQEAEVPLLLKTRSDLFDSVVAMVERLHPYETPCILGHRVTLVNEAYRRWVIEETR